MRALFVLVLLALATTSPAQIRFGEMGFQVQSPSGGTVGDVCWGFDCTPRPLQVVAGETLAMTVRAPLGGSFVIVFSTNASSCINVPGVWHQLVVDPPLFVLYAGMVDQRNNARFCYDGFAVRRALVPATIPSGFRIGLQAAATIGTPIQPATGWATSSAVLGVVR